MNEAQRKAIHLAEYYFRLIAQRAGVTWDGDNDAGIELMVCYIIDAAAAGLRGQLDAAIERIRTLEGQTPQARQLQREADLAAAGLAESGYRAGDYGAPAGAGRHGQCPYCLDHEPEPAELNHDEWTALREAREADEYDPGPEVDDEGGMSEYRYHEPEPWT